MTVPTKPVKREPYYSTDYPKEYDAALAQAVADGSIANWTWGQLTGKWPPPGTKEWSRVHKDDDDSQHVY
jgi:hypothetical protein